MGISWRTKFSMRMAAWLILATLVGCALAAEASLVPRVYVGRAVAMCDGEWLSICWESDDGIAKGTILNDPYLTFDLKGRGVKYVSIYVAKYSKIPVIVPMGQQYQISGRVGKEVGISVLALIALLGSLMVLDLLHLIRRHRHQRMCGFSVVVPNREGLQG